jgi:outer membrane protein TolC
VYQILPKEIEPSAWNDSLVEDDLYARAKKNRPEIRRIDLKLQKLAIDLKLAKNSYNPVLDLNAEISQDAGSVDTTRVQTEVSVGLVFEVPLQRRKAKGKITELEAKILQLKNKKVFLEESIFAEVKDAISELKNTEDQIKIVKREMELAKILEEGERIRFRNGKSTILVVNLREQATADTAVRKIKALARYNKAEAKLLATLGEI